MDLDRQIQVLVDEAPQDGITPALVAGVASALKQLAASLRHLEYYILENPEQGWVFATLSNRAQPDLQKKVVYAFPTFNDAIDFQQVPDPQVIAKAMPVTHILFQMFAMDIVDSTIFLETPGNNTAGEEVSRARLLSLVQTHLRRLKSKPKAKPRQLPSDIA